jgi:capsular polysaccharide biosynthesis protein
MERWGGHERPEYPGLASIATTARRRWWVLLVGTLAGAALATATAGASGPSYRANARLLVGPIGGEYSFLRAAGRQAETYVDLASSEPVLRAARARLRSPLTISQLRAELTVDADDVSRLLTITAQSHSAQAAAATANALAAALKSRTPVEAAQSPHELSVVVPAEPPSAPIGRRSKLLVAIAALAGLLGSLTLLVVVELARGPGDVDEELLAAGGAGAA